MTLGQRRLRRAVDKAGLSERAVAAVLGCSHSAMHRYLRGDRAPTGRVLVQIQAVFGIEPAAFFRNH